MVDNWVMNHFDCHISIDVCVYKSVMIALVHSYICYNNTICPLYSKYKDDLGKMNIFIYYYAMEVIIIKFWSVIAGISIMTRHTF